MQVVAPFWLSVTLSANLLEKATAQQGADTGRDRPGVTRHQDFADSRYHKGQRGTYRQKTFWRSDMFE